MERKKAPISQENFLQVSIVVVFIVFMMPVFSPQLDFRQWAWMLLILLVITHQVMFRSEQDTMQLVIILFFTVFAIREFTYLVKEKEQISEGIEAYELISYICVDADGDTSERCDTAYQYIVEETP